MVLAMAGDPAVTALACAPGNAGTATVAEQHGVDLTAPASVAGLAVAWSADLVVIGPEVPLVAGTADAVRAAGIACFGPSAQAARIEGSKAFAKDVMAAGKGVVVTADLEVARAHALALLDDGHPVLLESYLDGPEASLFCLVDSAPAGPPTVLPLLPAQDFKRVGEGDIGPNTGGMGAYAPLPWAPDTLADEVVARLVQPVAGELARRGVPFSGLLYAGLALTAEGPQVIEFNCRFGDPETQAVLALLGTPLAGLLHATATGGLARQPPLQWDPGAAVAVVLAAPGYPGPPRTGDVITGADVEGVLHAGTRRREDGAIVSAGGRVLTVVGTGPDLAAASKQAYQRIGQVKLLGAHYRGDIGLRASRGEVAVPTAR